MFLKVTFLFSLFCTIAPFRSSTQLKYIKNVMFLSPLESSGPKASNTKSLTASDPATTLTDYASLLIIPVVLPLAIPLLYSYISDPSVAVFNRQLSVISLLLFKRVYLYLSALTVLDFASRRAYDGYKDGLGERLQSINKEILPEFFFNSTMTAEATEMYNSIDNIDQNNLAIGLPLFVAFLLFASFAFLVSTPPPMVPSITSSTFSGINLEVLMSVAQSVAVIANVCVCFVFTRSVFKDLFKKISADSNIGSDPNTLIFNISEVLVAVCVTLLAFLVPPGGPFWPVHNIVNSCLVVTVVRVLQLSTLPAVVLALTGLTIYDVLAVTGTQVLSDSGSSVMEAIATAKLGLASTTSSMPTSVSTEETVTQLSSIGDSLSQLVYGARSFLSELLSRALTWRPGLLEVSVNGRVSDALGLGDIVFPGLLSGWLYRYESQTELSPSMQSGVIQSLNENPDSEGKQVVEAIEVKEKGQKRTTYLYSASLAGYAVGCVLNDLLMTGSGSPALLYLVPSMLVTVGVTSLFTGNLTKMWLLGVLRKSTDEKDDDLSTTT